MSTPPQASRRETAAAISDSRETSHGWVFRVWVEGMEGRMEWIFSRAEERALVEMSSMRTEAPSRRKRIVVSRPMPLMGEEVIRKWERWEDEFE